MQLGVFQHQIGKLNHFMPLGMGPDFGPNLKGVTSLLGVCMCFFLSQLPDFDPSLIVVSGGGVQGLPTGPGGQSGVPQSPRPQRPPSSGGVRQRVQLPPLVLHALIVCNPPKGKIIQTILPSGLQKEHLEKR